jgi:hypothetical protein
MSGRHLALAGPQRLEIAVLLAIILAGGVVVRVALFYPKGAVLYPSVVAGALLCLAAIRLAQLFWSSRATAASTGMPFSEAEDDSPREELGLKAMAIYATCVVGLVASLDYVWFPVAAFVSGALVLRFVFNARAVSAAGAALMVSGAASLVFWALEVPLPGPLPW